MQEYTARQTFAPAYVTLLKRGEPGVYIAGAWRHMEDCELCARYCHFNRQKTVKGAVEIAARHGLRHLDRDACRRWEPL
jgi:hypothetical protein